MLLTVSKISTLRSDVNTAKCCLSIVFWSTDSVEIALSLIGVNSIGENDFPASNSIGTKALEDFKPEASNPFAGFGVKERNVTLMFFKDLKNIRRVELYF